MERNYMSTADYTKYAAKQFEVSRVIVEKLGLKP